jgi:hypothetical protein
MSAPTELQQKKLTAAVAQGLFIEHFPLKFSIAAKFDEDHMMVGNLSSQTSITQAVDRYTRAKKQHKNPALMSSWLAITTDTVKNKAASAARRAMLHKGSQQMAIQIKVKRRTVTLDELTPKEKLQAKKPIEVKISDREIYYLTARSDEKDVDLLVIGEWQPLTGNVSMYHYQEGRVDSVTVAMEDKYLMWHWNAATSTPTAPVATK